MKKLVCIVLALFLFAVTAQAWFTPTESHNGISKAMNELEHAVSELDDVPYLSRHDSPSFCRGHDCPEFEEFNATAGYSVRTYAEAKWAWTTVSNAKCIKKAAHLAYYRLRRYFQGFNLEEEKMKMTVPVVIQVSMNQSDLESGDGDKHVAGAFYIPNKYQEDPEDAPTPRDRLVCAKTAPEFNVAVHSFEGYPSKDRVQKAVKELKEKLDKDEAKYCPGTAALAVYDNPWRSRKNRYNEIWIPIHALRLFDGN